MPVGNIVPKTDVFERTAILLGAEEFPSTVQQAMCQNEGYLMYRERTAHQYYNETVLTTGTTGTEYLTAGYLYVGGGKYDIEVHLIANCQDVAHTSYVWLQLGTIMASSIGTIPFSVGTANTTFTETFSNVTIPNGWYSLRAYAYGIVDTGIVSAQSALRQYEEA